MFWGFSEAINLYEEYKKNFPDTIDPLEINILLFGCGDPRNIFQTISKKFKYPDVKLNFYLLDGCIEIVARNMILTCVALENPEALSLMAKTHLFMDIYGNSLLRPFSYHYMSSKANALRKCITDQEYMKTICPIFNIENLKYRERDGLEEAFNFWLPKEGYVFDIRDHWDKRNRHKLATRYDYRVGAFDWDLQMNLKDAGLAQICSQEYRHFRDNGIAFTFPEFDQSRPNKTLAAGLVRCGPKYGHRGYIGDMETGPYCAFGVKCSDEKMLKSMHGTNDYRATDVTERNVLELFYEIQEKTDYHHNEKNTHKYGAACLLLGKILPESDNENIDLKEYDLPLLNVENTKIYFLSLDDITQMQEGIKYKTFFDIGFVANNYFPFLKNPFLNIFKRNSLILFETKSYTVSKKEFKKDFLDKIKSFATEIKLKPITNFNINLQYSIVKYKTCDEEVNAEKTCDEEVNAEKTGDTEITPEKTNDTKENNVKETDGQIIPKIGESEMNAENDDKR